MNARSTFNHILKQVEFSQLNYLISKTPLSAYISMKWSFVKSYDKPDHDQVQHFDAKAAVKIEDTIETSDHHDELEEEVLKLKSILVRQEETIVQQKHVTINAVDKFWKISWSQGSWVPRGGFKSKKGKERRKNIQTKWNLWKRKMKCWKIKRKILRRKQVASRETDSCYWGEDFEGKSSNPCWTHQKFRTET